MNKRNLSRFDNEDRISNLPDNLIHHILSLLDMKYAIRTSVMSRRWAYLWKSLPTLNIDDKLYYWYLPPDYGKVNTEKLHRFIDCVDRVLTVRESSDIQRLNLTFDYLYDIVDSHIHRWILAAVRHNVQELCLSRTGFGYTFEILHCLFSCESLTKLEILVTYDSHDKVVLPSSMSLPRLRSLRIRSLPFDDERLTNMLFSNCPVLESLILDSCTFSNVNLSISSSKLKHFKLSCYYEDYHTKVKLYAPNLTSIIFKSYLSKDHSLGNLSSLVTADIDLSVERRDQVPGTYELLTEKIELYAQRMVKFLRALHNVKVLTLSAWILQVVSRAPEISHNQPTQFFNLQRLKMSTFLSRECMDSIIYLLNNSPNIESLSLEVVKKQFDGPPMYPFWDEIKFSSGNTEVDYWETGLTLSPSVLHHLKFIEIRELLGCVNELKFLEILLKNALVLEKVVLFSSSRELFRCDTERRMIKFSDKLLSFPRASSSTIDLSGFKSKWTCQRGQVRSRGGR